MESLDIGKWMSEVEKEKAIAKATSTIFRN